MDFEQCLDVLEDWYNIHHGGCQDTSCAMSECESQGLTILASKMLTDAIGFDECNSYEPELERKAEKAYNLLLTQYKPMWLNAIDNEYNELMKSSHMECECGSIIWQPEWCNGYCSNCGKENGYDNKTRN